MKDGLVKNSQGRDWPFWCADFQTVILRNLSDWKSSWVKMFEKYSDVRCGCVVLVVWCSNKKAWIDSEIMTKWLKALHQKMKMQNQHILLFLCKSMYYHDLQLSHIKYCFLLVNTIIIIEQMEQMRLKVWKCTKICPPVSCCKHCSKHNQKQIKKWCNCQKQLQALLVCRWRKHPSCCHKMDLQCLYWHYLDMYIEMLLEKWHKKQHMRRIWTGTGKNEVRFQSMDEITEGSNIKLLSPRVDKA